MSLGDRIPTELFQSAITASAVTYFTNTSSSYRTQMTGLFIANTGSTARVVTLYKNGTGAANQIVNSLSLEANTSAIIDLSGKPLIFTGTQTFGAKQDTGTDVSITATGIIEQIV